jgi:Uncharacterized conserved protein
VFAGLVTGGISPPVEVDSSYASSNLPGKCKPNCYFVIRADGDTVKGSQQSYDAAKDPDPVAARAVAGDAEAAEEDPVAAGRAEEADHIRARVQAGTDRFHLRRYVALAAWAGCSSSLRSALVTQN